MGKQPRPKSKKEKLAARRKHILEEPKPDPLQQEFLDEGGSEGLSSDDELPEEISYKNDAQNDVAPLPEAKKKRKKRRIKKEAPGVFDVQTDDVQLKVVARSSQPVNPDLNPKIHFKDLLLAETSRTGRRKAGAINKHVSKWIKPRRATRQT